MVNLLHSMKYSFMVTTLSLLPLLDCVRGQDSCQALQTESRGDAVTSCCDIGLTDGSLPIQQESANKITSIPAPCDELQQEDSAFCKCVMDKIYSFWPAFEEYLTREDVHESVIDISRVKARVQNVSTSIARDLTFTLTPNEVPKELDTSVKGNVSNIKLPRGLFQSIRNETDDVKVAVLVLDVGKVGLFQDPYQTGTMLDNVVVSVKVGGRQITGLSDCVELTFSHGRLPQNVSGQCVFWDTKKGFPALVVTITGSMNSYGNYTIMDMANRPTATLCWIDSAHLVVHYVTNCSYFGLILLFNTLILVVVAWKLFCLQRATAGKEEKIEAWKGGLTVLGLSCLLGATWGLAFFTYGTTSVPAIYLFTVLNSLQGLFIFIWFTVLYYPKKDTATSSSGSGKNVEVTTASHSERQVE